MLQEGLFYCSFQRGVAGVMGGWAKQRLGVRCCFGTKARKRPARRSGREALVGLISPSQLSN